MIDNQLDYELMKAYEYREACLVKNINDACALIDQLKVDNKYLQDRLSKYELPRGHYDVFARNNLVRSAEIHELHKSSLDSNKKRN